MSRARYLQLLLALAIGVHVALAAMPDAVRAGDYTVAVCQDGAGSYDASFGNSAFGASVNGPASARDYCDSYSGIDTWIGGGTTWPGHGAALNACAPAGTRFIHYHLDLQRHWQGAGYNNQIDTGPCGGYGFLDGGWLDPSFDAMQDWHGVDRDFDGTGLRMLMECRWLSPCSGNWGVARYKNIRITVRDDRGGPGLYEQGGLWTATGWVRGTQAASFKAEDNVGVRRMRIAVDPATNGAGWPHEQRRSCDYSRLVPCETGGVATSYSFDTRRVVDGAHTLRYSAEDSGLSWTSSDKTFNVDNTAPAATLSRAAGSYGRAVIWNVSDARAGVNGSSLAATYSTDNGASWQSMSGSWNATAGTYSATVPPAVGEATLQVRLGGADNAQPGGNPFTSTVSTITVDSAAPSAPTALTATPTGWSATNSFEARWTNPDGQVSPIAKAHWKLCPAGQVTGCQTGSATGDGIAALAGLAVPSAGSWELSVWLEDKAGNTSAANAAGPVGLRYDASTPQKPTISVPSRWLNRDDPTYYDAELTTPSVPSSGIGGYSVSRDGIDPDRSIDHAGTTAMWRVTSLAGGATTIKARGVSGAGVASEPAEAVVRMDRELPTTTLRGAGSPDTPHPGPITVTLGGHDGVSGMGAARDDEPVTSGGYVAYKLDGAAGFTRVGGDEAQIAVTAEGAHVLEYFAVDAAGNRSALQSRSLTIGQSDPGNEEPTVLFWDRTVNPATTFRAATRFGDPCPDEATLTATRDATLLEEDPNAEAGGIDTLAVGPAQFRRESLIGFPLPAAPDCTVESAVLRVHAASFGYRNRAAGRPIEVKRASSAWTESGVTWNTRPGTVGPGVTTNAPGAAAPGWMEWNVTAQVQALYTYGDNGLYLRDAGPDDPSGDTELAFCSRESTATYCVDNHAQPQLVLRFSE